MLASRCCSAVGAGWDAELGLAELGSEKFAGSEVEAGDRVRRDTARSAWIRRGFGDEGGLEGLEDCEGSEGCGTESVGAAGSAAIGSRVGPQLAASKKKPASTVAAALRMFRTRPQRRLTQPSGRAAERVGESLRVSFLVKAAISPLSPSIQTNQGRSCGGGGSRLPTSWG